MTNPENRVAGNARTPVVFLHDAAIDEYIASMLIANMPGVDLLGIVVINADCMADPAMQAASRLLQFLGREEVPLALSRARGWNAFPWPYRRDCISFNALPILQQYQPRMSTPPLDGELLLARLLNAAIDKQSPITLLITGPMTTLMEVLSRDEALAKGIGQIVWMGGAVDVLGNLDPTTIDPVVANLHAEWNAFWDPFAVDQAFQRFSGIQMFPLDISNTATITPEFLSALKQQGRAFRHSQLAYEAYRLVESEPFYRLWDVTAACWLERPDLYLPAQSIPLMIEQWGYEQGSIHRPSDHRTEHNQNVFTDFADLPGFYRYVLELLATNSQ